MAYKIESVQWTIPVSGLQYTDVRPVISGDSWEDISMAAQKVAESVGNVKLVERLSGEEKRDTAQNTGLIRQIGDGVLFNETDHTYSKDGKQYLSGSTFSHLFEKQFPRESAAQKVADRDGKDIQEVLDGWDSKGEISLQYGTLVHKCIETWIKYGEKPNNEYLKNILDDWAESCAPDFECESELFLQDDPHQLCGVIDLIGKDEIIDLKTGDIHKKVQNTLGKEFPNDRLSLYALQLNFYRYLAEQNGKKINKLTIHWLNGEHWEKVKVDVIDIKPYLEKGRELWKQVK